MTEALKACPNPWCGSSQIIRLSSLDQNGEVDGEAKHCVECGMTGPRGDTEAEAIAAWNTRTSERDWQGIESGKFHLGDLVTKIKGSSWTGKVVGFYSTSLTPVGYAVESINEPGSVQIYPESALQPLPAPPERGDAPELSQGGQDNA